MTNALFGKKSSRYRLQSKPFGPQSGAKFRMCTKVPCRTGLGSSWHRPYRRARRAAWAGAHRSDSVAGFQLESHNVITPDGPRPPVRPGEVLTPEQYPEALRAPTLGASNFQGLAIAPGILGEEADLLTKFCGKSVAHLFTQ